MLLFPDPAQHGRRVLINTKAFANPPLKAQSTRVPSDTKGFPAGRSGIDSVSRNTGTMKKGKI